LAHLIAIAALIAGASACFSSSLHCHIIAQAYRVPIETIVTSPAQGAKISAWIDTWEHGQYRNCLERAIEQYNSIRGK